MKAVPNDAELAKLALVCFGIGFAGHPQWQRMCSDPDYRKAELTRLYHARK